jgi:hypothetical protein
MESDASGVLMRSGKGLRWQRLAMSGCERGLTMERKTLFWLLVVAVLFVIWLLVIGPQAVMTLLHLL